MVALHETIPLPRRLSHPPSVVARPVGSSLMMEIWLTPIIPSPTTLAVWPAEGPLGEVVEDSKEGIVSSFRCAMAKWKAI